MKKKILYAGISISIVVAALLLTSHLINAKPVPEKDSKKHNSMYVKAQKVELTETESDMVYRGRLTAFDNVSLAAEVQGKIIQGDVRFKTGESFHTNDILIRIYSKDIEASLKSEKSTFLHTLSKILPDLKVDYPEEYEKWNTFFNGVEVDKPLPKLPKINSNKEKVFLAANNVLASYYTLQQKQINLSRYVIHAPFSGSFKAVNKEIGAVASPGAELATIIRSDKLEVTVPVFPSSLKWIKKGDKVQVSDQNGDNKTATVSRISSFVDEATQSVDVYLTYKPNGNTGFLQGEYVDVIFKEDKVVGFEIPRESLIEGNYVYELKDKKLIKIPVQIVRQLKDSYIISGLENDKIIVTESLANVNTNIEYLAR